MTTSRILLPMLLLLIAGAAAVAQFSLGLIKLPPLTWLSGPEPQPAAKPQRQAAIPGSAADRAIPQPGNPQRTDAERKRSDFDIARIDPTGTSVFAGRAEPNSWVTVMADGIAVGTAKADGNGEWSLAAERRLPASPKLSIAVSREPPAPPAEARIAKAEPRTAEAVGREIVGRLESLVASARKAEPAAGSPALPTQTAAVADRMPDTVMTAALPAPVHTALATPIPIMFHYREATFTEDGRKAAGLLAEYVRLEGLDSLRLTGHADERGSVEANMELSRERLATVEQFLREAGYKGSLDLVPRGKSEPFTGVDRSKYPLDVLYQLDRRVELAVKR